MTLSTRKVVWGLIAVGSALRLLLAFTTYGSHYDIESFRLAADQLSASPFHFYEGLEAAGRAWPYPPLYFPWIACADAISDATALPFHAIISLPAIAADAAIACIVGAYVGSRGGSDRDRMIATALVALGPSFVITSGYHGQIDSVAILPAVAALIVWEGREAGRRAGLAGVLIGVGTAVKSFPIAMLLALLPSSRDVREGAALVAAAIATLLAVLVPWLVAEPDAVIGGLSYASVPGAGGISLVLQPGLAAFWLTEPVEWNGLEQFLFDNAGWVAALVALGLGAFLLRNRVPPLRSAVLVWLAIWVFGSGFLFHYLVWGLPFLIMAGCFRIAAAIQALVLVPALLYYNGPWESSGVVPVYATLMILLWAVSLAFLVVRLRGELRPI